MSPDWAAFRAEIAALREWVYLDTATFGQTPATAQRAVAGHLARRDATASADFLDWFDDADRIRANIGRLIGCGPDDIAFLPTASAALSLLVSGIDWKPGDRIVSLDGEFPNNLYSPALVELGEMRVRRGRLGDRAPRPGLHPLPWLNVDLTVELESQSLHVGASLCATTPGRLKGVEFVHPPWPGFWEAVTSNTRLVVLSSVNYTSGFRAPLEDIAPRLRERGVLLYVDGTQSVGALRMDVGALEPAMMSVDAYKWMLTPNGAGFAYVRPDVREWLRPHCVGWRSDRDWRRVTSLHHGAPRFSHLAEKYEGGMLPFAMLYAMDSVVEAMLAFGTDAIERRVLQLAADLSGRLERMGGAILHRGSQIVAARFEGRDAVALARGLRERKVLVSARHGNLRVSVHLYNHEEDLDRLESALAGSLQ